MKDPLFGQLEWNEVDGWDGSVSIDYFRDFGQRLPFGNGEPGAVPLAIDKGGRRTPPTDAQRLAWQTALSRGDALWDEVMARLLDEYRLQRPARVRWWKRIHGTRGLDAMLPDVEDAAGLKPFVRPREIRVLQMVGKADVADVAVQFWATFESDGFVARVRGGQVDALGGMNLVIRGGARTTALDHPAFGPLLRYGADRPWEGYVRCEPFRAFQQLARLREGAFFMNAPSLNLSWRFARGDFDLNVHAPKGRPPAEGQEAALDAFRADEQRNADAVLTAVAADYARNFERYQAEYGIFYPGDTLPDPEEMDADELRERVELMIVNVLPDGRTLGLEFNAAWAQSEGVGVLWREGRVERVGPRSLAAGQ